MIHSTLPNPGRAKEGGVTYWVHELAQRLALAGHQVTVYSTDPAPEGAAYRVLPIPAPAWARRGPAARTLLMPWFLNRIPAGDYDVIHAHGDDWFFPQRRVRTMYGSALGELRSARRWRRRLGQAVLVPLEALSAATSLTLGISEATRHQVPFVDELVPLGVDLERFHPGPRSERPSILFVGTVEGRKRGRLLLEQFEAAVRPRVPEAELWMVAEGTVVAEGVRSFGRLPIEEMARLQRQAWVFCLPSSYEGLGLPYLEAMASGTPVVATPNPGARELLSGGGGLIVEPEALGDTLARLLTSPEERERVAAGGRERAAAHGWDRSLEAHLAAYRRLMAGGRR